MSVGHHRPSLYTRRANRILWMMALAYGIVFLGQMYVTDYWYDALYWLVQSALIGSVADWFAVTALFRKPLGISFHTELIPRNKERLITGVVRMVETKLLTYEQCERSIRSIRFVPWIHQYVTSDTGRHTLQHGISSLVSSLWLRRSEADWARWGADTLRSFLHDQSVIGPLQQTLLDVCKRNRYESVVIAAIGALQQGLRKPMATAWLEAVITEEINKRRQSFTSAILIGLSEGLDIINVQEMAKAILVEVDTTLERWKEPGSTERIVWLQQWVDPLQQMASDPSVTRMLDEAVQHWIDTQPWETMLEDYICPRIREALVMDNGVSPMALILEGSLQDVWAAYHEDPVMVSRLEEALHHMAIHVLTKSHHLVGVIVRQVLSSLSTDTFIEFIESKVEDDLGWIRINGALVGGACGLGTWLFLYYIYEPFLRHIGWM